MADFLIENHGTIFLLYPQTADAREWARQFVSPDATWFAGRLVVEHRYISDIVQGARAHGLVVR